MKKVLFLLVALATITCISCKKGETGTTEQKSADTKTVTDGATVGDTATTAEAQVKIPTYDQVNTIYDESVLSELGMTKLRDNTTGQNEDTRGKIFYGKDAEVDANGTITTKGEHAIVVVENIDGENDSVTIYFSNQDDYNTYVQNNKKGETGQENGLNYVKYNDNEE